MSCRHKDEINCSIMYGTWKKLYPTTRIDCCKCFDCTCLLCIKSATLASLMFAHSHFSAPFRMRVERLQWLPGMGPSGAGGRWGAGGHRGHSPSGSLSDSPVLKAMCSWQFCGILLEWSTLGEWGESLGVEFLDPVTSLCP